MLKKYIWLLVAPMLISCTAKRPQNLGIHNDQLSICGSKPNCVSTTNKDKKHQIKPIKMVRGFAFTYDAIVKILQQNPQAEIIEQKPNYIYAEFTSKIFKFVDDVEFLFNEKDNVVFMRSASRVGYSDLGVNRKRLERIRFQLHQNQF